MNNNLPVKYKEDFFSKIIRKIKNLFFRSKNKEIENINIINEEVDNKKDNKLDGLRVDIEVDYKNYTDENERKKFLDNLTKNPDLLENFSTERLKKILQLYIEENEKKKLILKKINS